MALRNRKITRITYKRVHGINQCMPHFHAYCFACAHRVVAECKCLLCHVMWVVRQAHQAANTIFYIMRLGGLDSLAGVSTKQHSRTDVVGAAMVVLRLKLGKGGCAVMPKVQSKNVAKSHLSSNANSGT